MAKWAVDELLDFIVIVQGVPKTLCLVCVAVLEEL